MKYRADIDGLRAVAILPVVAFHYGFFRFSGGYVGVDIFFVISGFLITRIIFEEFSNEKYSIVGFYNRRVRRIFPALFVVFAAIGVAAVATDFPSDAKLVGDSITASVFFVSNVFFYNKTNYFETGFANPVLHTWSLSVEEQFYVLFPILMLALRPLSLPMRKVALSLVAALSFILSAYQVFAEEAAAFYLVQYRAWELLIGGLIAIRVLPNLSKRLWIEAIALTGFIAIAASVLFYTKETPFPGLAAALPCGGAVAILYAGGSGDNLVSRGLALPPVRFIGLISYSLYLWHWPLFVYASNRVPAGRLGKLELTAVAIAVSTASWWFVERPFRHQPFRLNRAATLGVAAAAMAVMSLAALSMGAMTETLFPIPELAKQVLTYERDGAIASMREGECFLTSRFNSFDMFARDKCLAVAADRPNVLILGDSHAAHLWTGYNKVFADVNFLLASASGCRPLERPSGERRCTDLVNYVLREFLPRVHLDVIILSARWEASDILDVVATADHLRKYATRVVISGPIEEYDQTLPRVLAEAIISNRDIDAFAAAHLVPERKRIDQQLAALKLPDGVTYVSVYSTLCPSTCRLWAEAGIPLQFDYGHLTKQGSIVLAKQVGPRFLPSEHLP